MGKNVAKFFNLVQKNDGLSLQIKIVSMNGWMGEMKMELKVGIRRAGEVKRITN